MSPSGPKTLFRKTNPPQMSHLNRLQIKPVRNTEILSARVEQLVRRIPGDKLLNFSKARANQAETKRKQPSLKSLWQSRTTKKAQIWWSATMKWLNQKRSQPKCFSHLVHQKIVTLSRSRLWLLLVTKANKLSRIYKTWRNEKLCKNSKTSSRTKLSWLWSVKLLT